jgi:hypothetical protein
MNKPIITICPSSMLFSGCGVNSDHKIATPTTNPINPHLEAFRQTIITRLSQPYAPDPPDSWQELLDRFTTGVANRDRDMNQVASLIEQNRNNLQVLVIESLYKKGPHPTNYQREVFVSDRQALPAVSKLGALQAHYISLDNWKMIDKPAADLFQQGGSANGFEKPFFHENDAVLLTYFNGQTTSSATWFWLGEGHNQDSTSASTSYAALLDALKKYGGLRPAFGNPDSW